ncbi:hypothetical protein L195_g023301, partial [Trifolium pratense]
MRASRSDMYGDKILCTHRSTLDLNVFFKVFIFRSKVFCKGVKSDLLSKFSGGVSKQLHGVATDIDTLDITRTFEVSPITGSNMEHNALKHPWLTNVLTNGIEVKLQRNALSVLEAPTGNEEDDDLEFDNVRWNNGSDM